MADQDEVTLPIGDCTFCPFRNKTLLMGRCMPGDTCVAVQSGRQIDRFFRVNPSYSGQFLQDNFWERRAIAARYAPQKDLQSLINEVVRRVVAYRLPAHQLQSWIDDPDREVRMTVADRINPESLELLAEDTDYIVRLTVVKRLPAGRLFRFIKDRDVQVRKQVAERIPEVSLGLMVNDSSDEVRRIVAERLNADEAIVMLNDEDWMVRYTVAQKVDPLTLKALLNDPEPDVRDLASARFHSYQGNKHHD